MNSGVKLLMIVCLYKYINSVFGIGIGRMRMRRMRISQEEVCTDGL